MNGTTYPASPKQLAFLAKMGAVAPAQLTSKAASAMIDALLKQERAARPALSEPGMYRDAEGAIYKVQRSKTDAARLYAKKLTPIGGQRLRDADEAVVSWEFVYAPGAVHGLTPAQRLTLDEAKAFGIRYGVCAVCGRTLKDAASVQQGIGPVCIRGL